MKNLRAGFLALFSLLVLLSSVAAQDAVPFPHAKMPKAVDRGSFTAHSGSSPMSVTLALRLPNASDAEDLMVSLHTPGNPQYHQFLTPRQFAARFAPKDADVAKVISQLASLGLSAERTSSTTLKVTGLPSDIERVFSVSLHNYEVAQQGNARGYSYHAPLTHATVPAEISSAVAAVVGLDSRPALHPLNVRVPQAVAKARKQVPAAQPGNDPGFFTVQDFAALYHVNPLYDRGISGKGRTVGIMTFASFTPSDAFAYWNALGLSVKSNRIKIVNVDGGPGAPSDASGSEETALDVEQSGGIAPGAKIIVYQAPNTNQGFVDLFARAIEDNDADTLSISWGSWEWFNNLDNTPVTDPFSGKTVSALQAVHELLVRAAIQGQTIYAASGDDGAYDTFGACFDLCNLPLSVDYPSSDTAITAGGGTTLPGLQEYCLNSACTPPFFEINIPRERVWGWDYLEGLCVTLGAPNPIDCGIFPAGTGGGVSVFFPKPLYQFLLPGVQRSAAGQVFTFQGQVLFDLPANYPGRNVPDVSFNADPETGYVIVYTSSTLHQTIVDTFIGGTSFVAPQLNGVSSLFGEYLGGRRIGLMNFPLYFLAISGQAYSKSNPPLNDIRDGNNWFYQGSKGYDPATGVGTMDVYNFAKALRDLF